ncbi:MAG: hypothetical protein Ct9H90mP18_09060 [Gammaproteobacteria bacterium]|nr:MAG: hypothetical protein Ct9H90mP18_09060 [Gammaproteobacteria bacterium]
MSTRLQKVQDLLHKEIAHLILTSVNNPIISKSVTIAGVNVSKDLRYCDVYFTTFNDDTDKVQRDLNKAAKYIRLELSKKVYLKRIPSIKFIYDKSIESSQKIDALINNVIDKKMNDCLILIDKPLNLTSNYVLQSMKKRLKIKKSWTSWNT